MWYIIILGLITLIYLALHLVFSTASVFEAYIVPSLLWIALAIVTFLVAQNEGLNIWKYKKVRKWSIGASPIHAGILVGGFQVSMLIIVGIFSGFGRSPYSFTPSGILTNAFFIGSLLIGTELSRAYLIKKGTQSRKYLTLTLVLVTLLYMVIQIAPRQFAVLDPNTPLLAVEFIGGVLITSLAINLLASYFAYLGGATASLAYMGTLLGFQWFSPVLPDPHWTVIALVGTIAPAIGYIIIQSSVQPFQGKHRIHLRRKKPSEHGWIIVAIFSLIIIFFSFGYLGVQPTVVYSGSMNPALDVGDIAIVTDVEPDDIQEGDIIQFIRDNVTILHRVVDIYEQESGRLYITQGDANDNPDADPVFPDYILGKSVFTIPKLGWIQIFVKDAFRNIGIPIT